MNVMDQPFAIWETVLYELLDSLPYTVLVLYAFRERWRFGRRTTFLLVGAAVALRLVTTPIVLFSPSPPSPLYDVTSALLYVGMIFLILREPIGKLVFTVLVLMDLGNLVVVLSKCIEGLLFPSYALLRYHFTYPLMMLPVQLILLPLIYRLILRGICSGADGEGGLSGSRDLWRDLWLIPAIFYLIWTQHFYLSGRSALENALDPVSTGYLLLIDAGSVLIYRRIVQLVRAEEKNRRLQAENHALSLQSVQYENLRRHIEEARRARHDLRHHLVLLRHIRDKRDFAALDELLASYPELESLERPLAYCENETVNSVLLYFADRAAGAGIRFTVRTEVPEDVFVEKPDLAVLFGNLLENAAEACAHVEGEAFVSVSGGVRDKAAHAPFTLVVRNSCALAPEPGGSGTFRSTKHEGDGIGIASVRSIAERYGGTGSFSADSGVFTASVILFPPPGRTE